MIAEITSERSRLRITGADRIEFLHGQCTNEIKKLPVGADCYVAFLNAKGKMRGDGHVLHLPDALLLETSHGMQATLEKFIVTEDVAIEDVSESFRQYLVIGAEKVEGVTYRHALGTGVLTPASLPVSLDAAALETLRIETGVPKYGVDMDETTIPVEAGLVSAISYDKGCYVGQETIARIKTYGHVNRQLVQLHLPRICHPARSEESLAGQTEILRSARNDNVCVGEKILAGDREVGNITSVVCSNRLGKLVALGYVRRELAVSGTKLSVGGQPAEVIKLCEV
jgi:folate-binding protein YgfZ